MQNIFISEQDVKDVLQNLKTNKACGIDMVNHRLLKESANIISKSLSLLFNKSLDMGRFPSQWKLANLIPIYIGKESHIIKNYRPSCLVKTFEGIGKHHFQIIITTF